VCPHRLVGFDRDDLETEAEQYRRQFARAGTEIEDPLGCRWEAEAHGVDRIGRPGQRVDVGGGPERQGTAGVHVVTLARRRNRETHAELADRLDT
jgi:hypothetical protein